MAGSVAALAQSAVISARSGLIHYVEGQVYAGDQAVDSKFGNFPEVKENQELRTEEGRAEVLLTPGVFLRLGEKSSFRMITNRLIDTRLEFLTGSAIVEADIQRDNSVTVVFGKASVHLVKKGLYRFDSSPAELRVFDGTAEVTAGDRTIEVKEGRLLALDNLDTHKFDKAATDALDRWSERRAGYVSMANVSAANSIRSSMYGGGMYGSGMYDGIYDGGLYGGGLYGRAGMFMGGWFFNPYFGMYTFVPGMGMGYSPYGYAFWSPFNVYQAYMPGYYYNPGYTSGYRGAYNTATRSVPAPAKSGGVMGTGRAGTPVAVGHGPVRGSLGNATGRGPSSSSGSVSTVSRGSGGGMSAPISHGGGIANSPHR